jgi:murein DD-endopeptidase MepM/ murein hydrolase activator NlpD
VRSLLLIAIPPIALALSAAIGGATGSVSQRQAPASYQAPIAGRLVVLTGFSPPATPYAKGHLGVDLAAPPGTAITAAAAGQVRFAGPVAGRGVIVIAHPDGLSTEYEPVTAAVHVGQEVRAGQLIGHLVSGHRSCLPASCLHWGARRGERYLDPLLLLRPLGVVRLMPWSDAPAASR